MFGNCFPNTLDTTVEFSVTNGKPDTFMCTGDIPKMWLRDSTVQVWPYLDLMKKDPALQQLIAGVIYRQTRSVLIDPYANGFHKDPTATGGRWSEDLTDMKPGVHERKWELDSLCFPIRLAYGYWKASHDTTPFDSDWRDSISLTLRTFREQQRKTDRGPYRFQRRTIVPTDSLAGDGYGLPIKPVGLICSMFRPSDDATIFPFLVPSNFLAVVSLRQAAELLQHIGEPALALACRELAEEVAHALGQWAIVQRAHVGRLYAYEVDGFGNSYCMDDSSLPNLLMLPYLGAVKRDDAVYRNTRHLVLSDDNPYYFKGKAAEGPGGPHAGLDMIWPLGIIQRALTSTDDHDIRSCLQTLQQTHAGTGFMHEAFNKDNPKQYTRAWFAWANTSFGELILKVSRERPYLLD
jgi:meiotically up-regulated gene 157 (Mug157) protein